MTSAHSGSSINVLNMFRMNWLRPLSSSLPGALLAPLHRDADLRQSDGGRHPERPQPQRPGLVRRRHTDRLPGRLAHHVPAG